MYIILSILTAAIPVYFWYLIIIRNHRKGIKFFFILVFLLAGGFALGFKAFESQIMDFLITFAGVFLGFVFVGSLIEYGKNFILRLFAKNYFKDINDVVDLAFATALGFTFIENILIFNELFESFQITNPLDLLKKIIVQEFFILPIHIISSGIFGYYYGLSLFAHSKLQSQPFFRLQQIFTGSIISMIFYGLFFWLKALDLRVSDIGNFFGYSALPDVLDERLLPFIAFGFFSIGSLFLFYKLEQKHFLTDEPDI